MPRSNYAPGPIDAKGAFTADFALPADSPLDQVASLIERDRLQMARRPGMRQKHLPMRIDADSGNFLSGGRYLFDSAEHAAQYKTWVENEFVLDGTTFFQRPYFLDPVYFAWQVIGAHDFADVHTAHTVVRFERWSVPQERQYDLDQAWPQIHAEAERRGLSSVWLLRNEQEQLAGLVSIADRVETANPQEPDFASLHALEASPSLGTMFDQPGWMKVFDRTSWVLTIWFPIPEGASDVPALWPNSPPLPAPIYA